MKSKRRTYSEKETACCGFYYYHCYGNVHNKSTVAASCTGGYCKNSLFWA